MVQRQWYKKAQKKEHFDLKFDFSCHDPQYCTYIIPKVHWNRVQ